MNRADHADGRRRDNRLDVGARLFSSTPVPSLDRGTTSAGNVPVDHREVEWHHRFAVTRTINVGRARVETAE